MNRLFNCSLVTLLLITASFAQGIEDIALRRGIGIRAAGMGGAYTAIADDAAAVFYNPAGLAEPGFGYTFGNLDTDEKIIDGSFELIKVGYIGFASWNVKDSLGNEVAASAIGFANRNSWLSWGINSKNATWKIGGVEDAGWAGDIGFLARITPQFRIGLIAQEAMTSRSFLVPAAGRIGIGFMPLDSRLIIAADLEIGHDSRSLGHYGVETRIMDGLAIRAGVDRGEPTTGLTLDLSVFSFDYALQFTENNQTIQRFELGLKVLPKRERPFSIIKPKEYALLDVSGAIRGGRDEYSFLGGFRPGLDSLLAQIRTAAKDNALDGIMLRIGGFEGGLGGMAVVQEIRGELERARKKGKKIIAYIEGSAIGDEYYLASVADEIVAPPGAAIGGFGKSIEIYRLKGLYKKLGIEWQVFKQGKYKNAFDPYSEKLTKEQEEMLRGLVADLYRQMLTDIASGRKKSLQEIKEIGDGMIFSAKDALAMGLIDKIGYFKDARKYAAEVLGEKKDEAKIVEPRFVQVDESFLTQFFGVAVIEIDGEIVTGGGGENLLFGGRYVGSETVGKYIKKAGDDVFVRAVILRINSPGGDAIAAGEIYEAIKYAKEKKKIVVASIGNIGASGGYYIAAAADKIVADPSSITGSIGVIGYLPVYSELLKKIDVTAEVIKEGKHADMFSGLRKLTPAEVAAIEKLQGEAYQEFVQAVVVGRKMTTAEVEAAAQGQIYTGSQALDLKLIDELGGFSDAVDLAKKEAKIMGEPRLIFYHEPSLIFPFGEGIAESLGIRNWFFGGKSSSLPRLRY